ncbi:hypothetical protein E3G54_004988 [Mycobacteroides abscessus]|nr:hypothetical protein [Mycobacteroides abscessus]
MSVVNPLPSPPDSPAPPCSSARSLLKSDTPFAFRSRNDNGPFFKSQTRVAQNVPTTG